MVQVRQLLIYYLLLAVRFIPLFTSVIIMTNVTTCDIFSIASQQHVLVTQSSVNYYCRIATSVGYQAPIVNRGSEYIVFFSFIIFFFPSVDSLNVSTEVCTMLFYHYLFIPYLCTSSEFWTVIGTVLQI